MRYTKGENSITIRYVGVKRGKQIINEEPIGYTIRQLKLITTEKFKAATNISRNEKTYDRTPMDTIIISFLRDGFIKHYTTYLL